MQPDTSLFVRKESSAILNHLQTSLSSYHGEPYLVGGYVRDSLLGRATFDIDLAVRGDVLTLARNVAHSMGGSFVLLNERHQAARVVLTREEDPWQLDFAPLRGDIEADLRERDFTIDAIAVEFSRLIGAGDQVELIDPLYGLADIEKKSIRSVSDHAFKADPARLLRAYRLKAELDFIIEEQTEDLIRRDRETVKEVSGERVREELGRILETPRAADTLRDLDRSGLLDLLIPELADSRGAWQPKEHYWDVFDHSMETVAAVERLLGDLRTTGGLLDDLSFTADLAEHFGQKSGGGLTRQALIKLAALLHDVAKPRTSSLDEKNGRIRFLGHAQQGATIVDGIMERLRFSTRERRMVTGMIEQHLRPGHLSNAPELPTQRAIYRYFRDVGEEAIDTLFLSLADHLATRGPELETDGWDEHVQVTDYMLSRYFEDATVVSPPRLINGHRLMSEFGLEPGPAIGEILEMVRESQAAGDVETEAEALEFVRKELEKRYANQG